ncbi:MAG TPA: pitrilysin family protein [Gemmatimonadaceae bacterium]
MPRRLAARAVLALALLASPAAPAASLAAQAPASPVRPPALLAEAPPRAGREAPLALAADTATTSYDVDGLRIIHRRTSNDVVAANLYLLGGSRQMTPATAGIELLLLAASERGTAGYSKERIRDIGALTGSSYVIDPSPDWTMFGFRGIRSALDSTWALFADRVMRPALEPSELELVRAQLAAGIAAERDDPDALLERLADSLTFAGHPYAIPPHGTETSIARLTRAELQQYHREQFVSSRMMLVVVGNIERAHLERLVRGTLATLPRGDYRWTLPDPPPGGGAPLVVEPRRLPTNYILGYYPGPVASSADIPALRVATSILSGRLFQEVRGRRNLTYAVHAPLVDRGVAAGGLYVTTVAPAEVLRIMREEVTRLQSELIDAQALPEMIGLFLTDYFLDNETNAAQADFLARAQLYKGDYRAADGFVRSLRAVTNEDIRRVARQYMRGMHWAYVGDPGQAPRQAVLRF